MICSLSNLEEKDLSQIQSLEKDLGKTLLAFSCHEIPASTLEADKLEKIQDLEKQLGLSLVAVDA
jgi:hypothetical protein